MVQIGLGETEKVFEWLQKALGARSLWLDYLYVKPQFDPLRARDWKCVWVCCGQDARTTAAEDGGATIAE
jgi:hypothetical protein